MFVTQIKVNLEHDVIAESILLYKVSVETTQEDLLYDMKMDSWYLAGIVDEHNVLIDVRWRWQVDG